MAQQNINIGSSANKGDGDPIRVAFTKVNANFTDLFARVVVLEGGGIAVAQDIQGDIFAQDSSLGYSSATNTHYGSFVGALDGDVTGSVFADNSTLIIDGVAGTINSSVLVGNLPALDGSALTGVFSATGAVDFTGATSVDFTGVTVTGTSYDAKTGGAVRTNYRADGIDSVDAISINSGVSGTANGNILLHVGTPNTNFVSVNTPIVSTPRTSLGNTSNPWTTVYADNFDSGSATNNIAVGGSTSGTITIGSGSNNVDYPSGTTVDFTGATITGTSFLTAETISLTTLKTEVAASADFADFQVRIAAL